ncbi:succinylglutamate desuccinylase [Crenobacter cavernae]|uniref:Succinylglutamate desuccinylase n=1 Tax=Crenobacter cavernae TaxID=2290923 RepID=A0ABY0FGE1_9NEIS|nr:succinylglutamate desuccinylase [Crenobacter cavernae]RXZ44240.1 succinylglutamate desuccinylase [Crenobacter cavernae]
MTRADFSLLAATLAAETPDSIPWTLPGGATARWIDVGALVVEPAGVASADLLLSAGVHGNETAPVEVVEAILADLIAGRLTPALRLMVLLGNPAALATGERYLDYDLNRLFNGAHARHPDAREARRAVQLEALAAGFFEKAQGRRLHYDLHTAIRGSVFEKFAICPYLDGRKARPEQFAWLEAAGVEALLLHSAPASTFTYSTSHRSGADAFTLELGKARPFGQNDLSRFAGIDHALRTLIATGQTDDDARPDALLGFRAKFDIVKLSDAFRLHLDDAVENFTVLPDGMLIAEDGDVRYLAKGGDERILFPNPKVKNGLRAGIVVEPVALR